MAQEQSLTTVAYVGGRVNDLVGLELSYVDLGEVHRSDGFARTAGAVLQGRCGHQAYRARRNL